MDNETSRYYTEEGLRKLQLIELSILKEFDELCRKNGLDYLLMGGSMIGQIRHGGFIPWDDDIDVAMPRDDYEAFLRIANEQYADKYFALNNDNNPRFPLMNTRWGLKGTTYKTWDMEDIPGEFGIFLDVFPFDEVADDEKAKNRHVTGAWFWGKMLTLSGVKQPRIFVNGWKARLLNLALRTAHGSMKLFHVKSRTLYLKAYKYATQYRGKNTRRVNYMHDPHRFATMVDKSVFYPTKRAMFENIEVNIANHQEIYLEQYFGDYMQLPPVEKRKIHPPAQLDFGQYGDIAER